MTIRLDMTETSCVADVSGLQTIDNGRIRVDRGAVVRFEYTNRTDAVGGVAIRTIAPGVSLADLNEEAAVGIPTSFEAMLAISFVAPGAETSVAAVMAGSPFVPNCILIGDESVSADFIPMIVSPDA